MQKVCVHVCVGSAIHQYTRSIDRKCDAKGRIIRLVPDVRQMAHNAYSKKYTKQIQIRMSELFYYSEIMSLTMWVDGCIN